MILSDNENSRRMRFPEYSAYAPSDRDMHQGEGERKHPQSIGMRGAGVNVCALVCVWR